MAKKEEGKPVVDPDAVDEVLVRLRLISDLVNTADAIVDQCDCYACAELRENFAERSHLK